MVFQKLQCEWFVHCHCAVMKVKFLEHWMYLKVVSKLPKRNFEHWILLGFFTEWEVKLHPGKCAQIAQPPVPDWIIMSNWKWKKVGQSILALFYPLSFGCFFFFFPGHHCLYIYAAVLPLPKCENWLKIDAVVYDVIVYFKD